MNKHLMHILLALHVVPPAAFALSPEQDDFKLSREKRIGIEYIASNNDLKKTEKAKIKSIIKKTKSNSMKNKESQLQNKPRPEQSANFTVNRQPPRKQNLVEEEEGIEE